MKFNKRIFAKVVIVAVLYGFYGVMDSALSIITIYGLSDIEQNQNLDIDPWVYDFIYFAWLYDYLLVLGLLIAVFFRYELQEPFRKLIRHESR